MKKLSPLLPTLALLSLLALGGCESSAPTKTPGLKHLLNRPWVAKVATSPKEMNTVLVFLEDGQLGVALNGSSYQHLVTVLRHEEKGNVLAIELLQVGRSFEVFGNTYECEGPEGLDLCLELGPKLKQLRLYSSSEWEVGEVGTPSFGLQLEERPRVRVAESPEPIEAEAGWPLLLPALP
ncbi:MAG: hypothetical protein P1V51_24225 [Deltaproteobacteria bacterium]|nr:hypothetical protein [Deltaproteobacteria bacterium]